MRSRPPVDPPVVTTDQLVPFHFWIRYAPTATQLDALVHAMAEAEPTVDVAKLSMIDQRVPSHRSTSVDAFRSWEPVVMPTAKHAVTAGHDTPDKMLTDAPETLGLETIDHAVPFHRSVNVNASFWCAFSLVPTAMHDLTVGHATLESVLAPTGSRLFTTRHALPFQYSANVDPSVGRY